MAFSSVRDMVELCKETGQPLYEVILESDLTESGLTRAESEAEMHRLWSVMCATSAGYCSTDRSMSGLQPRSARLRPAAYFTQTAILRMSWLRR